MKINLIAAALCLLGTISTQAQTKYTTYQSPGMFSLGTRNTVSMFNHDNAVGVGIGGQARVQLLKKIGSEWFFDYIPSKNGKLTFKNDYHFGWSIMYYPSKNTTEQRFIQPYMLVGHCFDYSKVTEQANRKNYADRWSMATQAGLGTHFNFGSRLDASLSAQYMLHFGKEIETSLDKGAVIIEKASNTSIDGHFLVTLSINYKLFHWWNRDDNL